MKIWARLFATSWVCLSSGSSFSGDLPIAASDSYGVAESSVFTTAAPGVLGNDYDNDGNALLVVEVQADTANVGGQINLASGATLILGEDGSFTYDPTESVHKVQGRLG